MRKQTVVVFFSILATLATFGQTNGEIKDNRQGNIYKTVKIGEQQWMSENLNEIKFQNGDIIKEAKTKEDLENAMNNGEPSWCYYNFDKNQSTYGRIYNWFAVNDPRGLAPKGWHIPTRKEILNLITYLGGEKNAFLKIKSKSGWDGNKNGNNSSGLSAFPTGEQRENGSWGIGLSTSWWSRTQTNDGIEAAYTLGIGLDGILISPSVIWNYMSVRCIKN